MRTRRTEMHYHLMLLPGMLVLLVFSFIPMFGVIIAFQNFIPARGIFGSDFVGLDTFAFMFQIPDVGQVFKNTVIIAVLKIAGNLLVPLVFALVLYEAMGHLFKRTVQTVVYLPHFLSWVILAGIFINVLSLDGIVNRAVEALGGTPTLFLGSNAWFRPILVATDVWKEFGFGTVIYLAAITGVSPVLYEAAVIDGASRMQQLVHVTLPGIASTIVLLATLNLGNVLNAGFDQVFNLYNPLVYSTGDIIDTYVYRLGLVQLNYSLATAVGLLKSVIGFGLIGASSRLAYRYANYRIF